MVTVGGNDGDVSDSTDSSDASFNSNDFKPVDLSEFVAQPATHRQSTNKPSTSKKSRTLGSIVDEEIQRITAENRKLRKLLTSSRKEVSKLKEDLRNLQKQNIKPVVQALATPHQHFIGASPTVTPTFSRSLIEGDTEMPSAPPDIDPLQSIAKIKKDEDQMKIFEEENLLLEPLTLTEPQAFDQPEPKPDNVLLECQTRKGNVQLFYRMRLHHQHKCINPEVNEYMFRCAKRRVQGIKCDGGVFIAKKNRGTGKWEMTVSPKKEHCNDCPFQPRAHLKATVMSMIKDECDVCDRNDSPVNIVRRAFSRLTDRQLAKVKSMNGFTKFAQKRRYMRFKAQRNGLQMENGGNVEKSDEVVIKVEF